MSKASMAVDAGHELYGGLLKFLRRIPAVAPQGTTAKAIDNYKLSNSIANFGDEMYDIAGGSKGFKESMKAFREGTDDAVLKEFKDSAKAAGYKMNKTFKNNSGKTMNELVQELDLSDDATKAFSGIAEQHSRYTRATQILQDSGIDISDGRAVEGFIDGHVKGAYTGPFKIAGNYASGDGSLPVGVVRYGAAAATLRYATGGTMTRNNRGEKDIAGIPFF